MTRKDFELIAEIVRTTFPNNYNLRVNIAERFADRLAETNPRFDRERFVEACVR